MQCRATQCSLAEPGALVHFQWANRQPGALTGWFCADSVEIASFSGATTCGLRGVEVGRVKKRFYIIFVARESDGRLRKVPVPLHYAYIFFAAALVGAFTIAGMAGSYSRMLLKTASFNQVRSQREALRADYAKLQVQAQQKDVQAASLGSLAGEVSALYGFHTRSTRAAATGATPVLANSSPDNTGVFSQQAYARSLDQFAALRTAALSGQFAMPSLNYHPLPFATNAEQVLGGASIPNLWPVSGRITSSFGERTDPFNGEGAFHAGVDIAAPTGTPIYAPADGVVAKAGPASGYGHEVIIDHGGGISTLYGHLSSFAVVAGQIVKRGQVIGYVGDLGRSTGPHLHYEVLINNLPVNPHKYMRETEEEAQAHPIAAPAVHPGE
jgi:murein DD-endopeptidase MepM/ murein hydrolase activator NlpD